MLFIIITNMQIYKTHVFKSFRFHPYHLCHNHISFSLPQLAYTNAYICQGNFYFFEATCFAAMEIWPIVVDMNKQKYESLITLFISNLRNS